MNFTRNDLRDYQRNHLDFLLSNLDKNVCVQMPTGTGKTPLQAVYIKELMRRGINRILVLTPSRELVNNLETYLPNITSKVYSGVAPDFCKPVVISTYQSALKYLDFFMPEKIIIDETHLCMNNTYQAIFQKAKSLIPGVTVTGFTATPNRLDGKPLKEIFDLLSGSPSIRWFINKGYLSDYKLTAIECPLFSGKTDSLNIQNMTFGTLPEIKKTVDTWLTNSRDKKTIIFATTIEHGLKLQSEFNERGINAAFLSSKTATGVRENLFSQYKQGKVQVLINVDLFTTGINVPDIEAVYLCRFTYSEAMLFQMIGRGLRKVEGKKLDLFDLAGNCWYFGDFAIKDDWSLESDRYKGTSNKDATHYKCDNCGADLVKKNKVTTFIDLCCMECQHVTLISPPSSKLSGADIKTIETFVGKNFKIADYKDTDFSCLVQLTKSLRSKKFNNLQKISLVMEAENVEDKLRILLLMRLGLTKKTAEYYLEE